MARRASGEREQFWRGLIERQPASGLSIARFCNQAGVSANSFYIWKRRLRPQLGQARRSKSTWRSSTLVRSARSHGAGAAGRPLVPVRLIADSVRHHVAQATIIEVEWPNGLVLRLPMECDSRTVRDVVKALAPLLVGEIGETASC